MSEPSEAMIEEQLLREALEVPETQARIAVAIGEAVSDQGFELSPPQMLYAALKAIDAALARRPLVEGE